MSIIQKTSRRTMLKLGGTALAAGIAAPHLWIPRVGHAKIPASKKHHVLIYFLDGAAHYKAVLAMAKKAAPKAKARG